MIVRALLFIALCFAAPEYLYTQNLPVQFSFKLDKSAKTSAGVYTRDSVLVRTLWSGITYKAGTHQASWDRKNDEGHLLTDTSYMIRVLSNNVTYTWEGVVGNTSDSMTGPSVIRMFRRFESMIVLDSTAYFASGYGEGTTSAHKLNLNKPQNKISILQSHSTDQNSDFVATDGGYVYWSGYDPYNPAISWTYATTVSGDAEVKLDSGKRLSPIWGRTYSNAIDIIKNDSLAYPTGLAVQKAGNYLFVAHGKINSLHVLDKNTGELLHQFYFRDVRGITIGKNDNLWMITGKDSVSEYTVNSNGTLSAPLRTLNNVVKPLAIGISLVNNLVTVVDGASSQQVKAYDYSSGNPAWIFGKKGGYVSGPEVTNDKFYFDDRDKPLLLSSYDKTFITFEPDGSFWIGDQGNERVQHYDSSRLFIETIMQLPHSYNVAVDANDPTRVFNEFLEFKIDYSKPLKPGNESWKLVKNWRYGVSKSYYRGANGLITVFYDVTTLNNGRTYAMMAYIDSNNNVARPELVELPDTGHIRFTGIRLSTTNRFLLNPQGTIRQLVSRLEIGQGGRWEESSLKGFDSDNNPVWDTAVIIARIPLIKGSDPAYAETARPEITSSGVLLVFNPGKLNTGFHLGAVKSGQNTYAWKTAKSTTSDYMGPFPQDGSFDIGNGVKYPGGDVYAVDRNIFWNYHGEFWKNSQTNMWNHLYDNGLMVSQFGVTSVDGELLELEAFPMGAGNVFSSVFVKVDSSYYLYHNDESVHAGIHRWKISGLNTIVEQSVQISIKTRSGGLGAAYFNGTDLDNFKRKLTRVDSVVQQFSAPAEIDSRSHFSSRWTGFIEPPATQDYTFLVQSNKGIRLWIDGQLLIDKWAGKQLHWDSSKNIALEAGRLYTVRLESSGDTVALNWHDTSTPGTLIPSAYLYPADPPSYEKGIDMQEGLNGMDTLQTGLYGWTRNPVYEKNNPPRSFWMARNGVRNADEENPDLFLLSNNDSVAYEVTRKISLPNTCMNAWELSGNLNYEGNMPNQNSLAGGFFDVLDDSMKIISRITHSMVFKKDHFQGMIICNDSFIINQHINVLSLLTNKPQPFSLQADSTGILFSYADFQPIHVPFMDSVSYWKKPAALRFSFINGTSNLNRVIDVQNLKFKITSELSAGIGIQGKTSICDGDSVVLTADSASAYLWSNLDTGRSIVVRSSGIYSVKVTDRNACSLHSESTTVTVNALPESKIKSNRSTNLCSGDSVILTADSASLYVWNTSVRSRSIKVGASGNYKVKVTDTNGCSANSSDVSVIVNPLPVPVITAGSTTTFCQGDSVVLTAGQSASYLWSNNATTRSITVYNSGNYKVTVKDSNGCSGTSSATSVIVNTLPVATISASGPGSFCFGDSVILTAGPGASYLWNTNETRRSIKVVSSGNYSVKVTDVNGCFAFSSPKNIKVHTLPLPNITSSGPKTFCSGDSVLLTASISSSYLWNNNQTSRTIKVTSSGNYTVRVTDTNACSANSSATSIVVNALPAALISAGSKTTFCRGDSVVLTASQASSYLWSNNATTRSITVSNTEKFRVKVTDSNGCKATSAELGITVNPLPSASITVGGASNVCFGDSVKLTASAASSYLWNTNATTRTVTVINSGNYSVKLTDSNTCVSISLPKKITVNALPSPVITASGPTSFCKGDSVHLTVSAAVSYLWNTNATGRTITAFNSGNYQVKVTDVNGCIATATFTGVKANALPIPLITSNRSTIICSGDSVILTANNASAYLWSTGAVTKSVRVSTAGNYTVKITDSNSCKAVSSATTVKVNTLPSASITAGSSTTFCNGDSVILTANPAVAYKWNTNATTRSVRVLNAGTYSVKITDTNSCSAISSGIKISVNPLPLATINAGSSATFCDGDSVVLTAAAAKTYIWSTNDTSRSVKLFKSGTYTVKVTDTNGCFAVSTPLTVKVNALPNPLITANSATAFCSGDSVILTTGNASSYLWNTNATSKQIAVRSSGNYTVKVTGANGCSALSPGLNIVVYSLPNANISANTSTEFCNGDSVRLTAGQANSYLWNTNATSRSILVSTQGNYTVKVKDTNGCVSAYASAVTVKVNPLPSPVITASKALAFCDGDSVILTSSKAKLYQWSTNDTIASVTIFSSGNYKVKVVDSNGCSAISASVSIKVHQLPQPLISANGPTTFCSGDSVVLSVNPEVSYLWSNTDTKRNTTIKKTGNYSVSVTDSNGCSAYSTPVSVLVNALPNATVSAGSSTAFCQGDSVLLTASQGATFKWSTSESTRSIIVRQSGKYKVQVADTNLCSALSSEVSVRILALPVVRITNNKTTTFCDGDSILLTASMGRSYQWNTNDTAQRIAVYKTGTYRVRMTDSNGCSALSSSLAIQVNASPRSLIIARSATSFCNGDSVVLAIDSASAYLWNNGDTAQSIKVVNSGNYYVKVTDSNTCSSTSDTLQVTVYTNPSVFISANNPTTFCMGDSVVLTSTQSAYYNWSTSDTGRSVTVMDPGNYAVAITDTNGCSAVSAPVKVIVNQPKTPTVSAGSVTTFCDGDSVHLTAGAGVSYLWNNNTTTKTITVFSSGNYSVTVTDSNGCVATSTPLAVKVNALPDARITAGSVTAFCEGDSVKLSAGGGHIFRWNTNEIKQTITVLKTGLFAVKVTDSNGCSALSGEVPVKVHTLPDPVISAGSSAEFCDGDSVILRSSAAFVYTWNTTDTGKFITVKNSGNYTVRVTDTNACSAESAPFEVQVNPLPVAAFSANGPTAFCQGDSVRLSAGSSGQYIWSTSASSRSITVLTSGSYFVKMTDSNGCSATSASLDIVVHSLPVTNISSATSTTFCDGDSVVLDAGIAAAYEWNTKDTSRKIVVYDAGLYMVNVTDSNRCSAISDTAKVLVNALPRPLVNAVSTTTFCDGDSVVLNTANAVFYRWNTNDSNRLITVYKGGKYSVAVTDSNGCSATSSALTVQVNALPVPLIMENSALEFCDGDSVKLKANTGILYQWSTQENTQSIQVFTSGKYAVNITDSNGCSAKSALVEVVVHALPVPRIAANGSAVLCAGDSVMLSTNPAVGYLWNTGDTSQYITVFKGGNYQVKVIDTNGCSATSALQSVKVNALPEPLIFAQSSTSFCDGDSVVLNSSNAKSYKWNTNDTTQKITVLNTGNYTVTVTDTNTCAATSKAISVNVHALPVPVVTALTSTTFCKGDSVRLTVGAFAKYLWNTKDTTNQITVLKTGSYQVKVIDSNACSATSLPATVKVNDLPFAGISAVTSTTFCDGDSVVLTASQAKYYLWDTNDTTRSITVLNSGTYNVRLTDTNFCTATSATVRVKVNALPKVSVKPLGKTVFCDGDSVVLKASAGKTYLWNNSVVTDRIVVYTSGTYSVRVTDTNGCSDTSDLVSVVANPLPVAVVSSTGSTTVCDGDSVSLTASAGASYLWNNSSVSRGIKIFKTGSFTVRVTDSNGCKASSDTAKVIVNVLPAKPSISYRTPLTFCQGDSVVLLSGNALAYQWNTNDQDVAIKVFASGTYNVKITDSNGCSSTSDAVIVKVNILPDATIKADAALTFCKGDSVTLSAGPGLSYLWNNQATGRRVKIFNTGNYAVTVKDTNGCYAYSDTFGVRVNPLPKPVITAGSSLEFCQGDSVRLTAENAASYRWNTNDTSNQIWIKQQGNYSVRVTDTNGCSAFSATLSVKVNALPAVPVITASASTQFCQGDSVKLTSGFASAYRWSNNLQTREVTVYKQATYTVRVTDTNACSALSLPFRVTVYPLPVATLKASKTTVFCQGDSVILTVDSASTYLWSTSEISRSIKVKTSGTYTVRITDSNNCSVWSNDTVVTVNALPAAPTITAKSSTTFCQGDSVSLSSSQSTHYLWNTADTGRNITVRANGSYKVRVTDLNGCSSSSSSLAVKVNTPVVPMISSSGNTTFCDGDSLKLTSSLSGTYVWNNNTYKRTAVIYKSGQYTVRTTDSNGCSATSQAVNVKVNALPQPMVMPNGPITFCQGDSVILATGTAVTYLWNNANTKQQIIVKSSGNYYVRATDTNACSATSQSVIVKVKALPLASVKVDRSTEICQGDSVILTADPIGTYIWSTSSNAKRIAVSNAGTYQVEVTDSNNCSAWSAPVNIVVNTLPDPAIVITGVTGFCQGDSVVLEAVRGYAYDWNTGEASSKISVKNTGSYKVKVTDTNGCFANSVFTPVTVYKLPAAVILKSGPTTFCQGDSVVLSTAGNNVYLWNNGDTAQTITVTKKGNYQVMITDTNGCSAYSKEIEVIVNTLPIAGITADKPTSFCGGDTVTLSSNPGKEYRWNTNAASRSIKVSQSGDYFVTVIDSNGCSAMSTSVNINTQALPVPVVMSSGPTDFCRGDSVVLTASQADQYLWSDQQTTQTIVVRNTGNYTVKITGTNGCYAFSGISTVRVNELPVPVIIADRPINFCAGDSVTLTVAQAKYYDWNTNETSRSITIFKSGDYQVNIIDSNGCASTSVEVNIVVNPLPVPVISADGSISICSGDSVMLTVNENGSYLWNNNSTSRRIAVSKAGKYEVRVTDGNSCTAMSDMVEVTVHSVSKPVISRDGRFKLLSSAAEGNQWYRNGVKIDGASASSYEMSQNGTYTVSVSDSGCTKISDTIIVQNVGMAEIIAGVYIQVMPNPSEGRFILKSNLNRPARIQVFNTLGEIVYESDQMELEVDLTDNAKGVYSVRVQSGSYTWYRKLVLQ